MTSSPPNTFRMKTLLQSNRKSSNPLTLKSLAKPSNMKMLTRGAGAQFIMSIPHGAVNFAVLEYVRRKMNNVVMKSTWASDIADRSPAFGPALDFLSSAIATICCSVVSTPQMMVVDNIMAGTYPNFSSATVGLSKDRGISGFYGGWWPGLVGKIPSYVSCNLVYMSIS
jgi:solute carrier family 25 S-adenosylmethionine transporter 26